MADPRNLAAVVVLNELLLDEEMEIIDILEQNRRRHRYWVRPWIQTREDDDHINTAYKLQQELILYDDTYEFRTMLRMPPPVYFAILEQVRDRIRKKDTNWRNSITPEQRLSLTLKYLAFGEEPASLSETFRVGRCTVARIIIETCTGIYEEFHEEYLPTPCTEKEWLQISNDFDKKWNFPACIGALDGKHIRISKPPKSGSNFFNYKKFFSIVLMALCNANYEFIYVDVGAQGKAADGGIWRECSLKLALDNDELHVPRGYQLPGTEVYVPYHIVADNAFGLSRYLQKPHCKRMLTDRELIYNYRLSRARRIVENCFGILRSRFHVFKSEIQMNPDAATTIVMACVTLHNILRKCCGLAYITHTLVDREDINHDMILGDWRREEALASLHDETHNRNPTRVAKEIRETLSDYFLTPQGEVNWQYGKIH